jgi:hypothetical protein
MAVEREQPGGGSIGAGSEVLVSELLEVTQTGRRQGSEVRRVSEQVEVTQAGRGQGSEVCLVSEELEVTRGG